MSYSCLCKSDGSLCRRKCRVASEASPERPFSCPGLELDDLSAAISRVADMVYDAHFSPDWVDGLPEPPSNVSADGLHETTPEQRLLAPTFNQHSRKPIIGANILPAGGDEDSGPTPPLPDIPPRPPVPPKPEPEENNTPQLPSTGQWAIINARTSVGGRNMQVTVTENTRRQMANAQDLVEQEDLAYGCNKCVVNIAAGYLSSARLTDMKKHAKPYREKVAALIRKKQNSKEESLDESASTERG
ncbi:hypothetical protein BJY00DRAFT_316908 [Aspergillus carlsbadensis]|nr:hypothetical protein BJY00DRAFT_316908 [Aspergillus carlsbadensis]